MRTGPFLHFGEVPNWSMCRTGRSVELGELRMRRPGSPLQFMLYPMVHVGSREFYQEVTRRLAQADVVVAEGVGRCRAGAALTMSYRAMAEDARLGLMVQKIDFACLPGQVLYPDTSGEEFQSRWQQVPWWQRAGVHAMTRFATGIQRIFGSAWRQKALENSSLEDLPSKEEVLQIELLPDVTRMVLDERDVRLVRALDDLHERRAAEPITVAVVYGAQHMRAVVAGLRRHDYFVRAGDWLTVMIFDEPPDPGTRQR